MKRVLLIDPALSFARFLSLILMRMGYSVEHATDAETGLLLLKQKSPSIILSESRLPGLSGVELCSIVRKDPEFDKLPFIIVTVDGLFATRQAAYMAGITDYVTKPVTVRTLHALMQRHLPFHAKRHHIRAEMVVSVTVDYANTTLELRTLSMGEGGVFLQTNRQIPEGSILSMTLQLNGLETPLVLKGVVVYSINTDQCGMPMGVGVKFIEMDQHMVTLLSNYMESYLSDFLPDTHEELKRS